MRASNPETIYSAGSGDWTQARLITVSGSARTVPMSHRDKQVRNKRTQWTNEKFATNVYCVTPVAAIASVAPVALRTSRALHELRWTGNPALRDRSHGGRHQALPGLPFFLEVMEALNTDEKYPNFYFSLCSPMVAMVIQKIAQKVASMAKAKC